MPTHLTSVHAPSVWFLKRGEGVRVGIIGTGMDLGHPDLQAAYSGGYDFVHNVSRQTGQIIRERGASVLVDSYVTDYDAADGASMSAPHVAAVAALVRATHAPPGGYRGGYRWGVRRRRLDINISRIYDVLGGLSRMSPPRDGYEITASA